MSDIDEENHDSYISGSDSYERRKQLQSRTESYASGSDFGRKAGSARASIGPGQTSSRNKSTRVNTNTFAYQNFDRYN